MSSFDVIGKGAFYNCDCIEAMKEGANNSVDLVLTSPPYDDMRNYTNEEIWTFDKFKLVAKELSRVLKDGGVIVWIVGDQTIKGSETGNSFKQALFFKDECKLNLHDTMIWNKGVFSAIGSLKTRYGPVFEYMFVFVKGNLKTFNPLKDRPNKSAGRVVNGTNRLADGTTKPFTTNGTVIAELGQRFNVWEISAEMRRKENAHPAPFPLTIAEDHIKSWSNEGDLIYDPFAGSGTTCVAAENLNRRWVASEISSAYTELAKDRIRNAIFR